MVTLDDIEANEGSTHGLGQNEYARHQLVSDFLADRPSESGISSHIRTNLLLSSIMKSMCDNTEATGSL